jgi:1-phosphofructokinase family hexose kinase
LIAVITLSPAIDVTYQVHKLVLGESHRVQRSYRLAGGKALNVARVLKSGGHQTALILPTGGQAGLWLLSELEKLEISYQEVETVAETRTCVSVVDKDATVFNEPAPSVLESEFEAFLAIIQGAKNTSVGVLSGSLPAELTSQQISRLLKRIRDNFPITVIDTSGTALIEAAKLGFDLLKPNQEELFAATGMESVELGAAHLLSLGAKRVLVSLGELGAKLFTDQKVLSVQVSEVKGNPTGAGDAMVAAASWCLDQGFTNSQLLQNAAAAGSLAVLEPVAGQIDWEKLADLASTLEVEEVS